MIEQTEFKQHSRIFCHSALVVTPFKRNFHGSLFHENEFSLNSELKKPGSAYAVLGSRMVEVILM